MDRRKTISGSRLPCHDRYNTLLDFPRVAKWQTASKEQRIRHPPAVFYGMAGLEVTL